VELNPDVQVSDREHLVVAVNARRDQPGAARHAEGFVSGVEGSSRAAMVPSLKPWRFRIERYESCF
jgi:hypothetical protein